MTTADFNARLNAIAVAARDYQTVVESRIGKLAEATAQCTSIALELKTWGENIRDSAERIERAQTQDRDRYRIWHADHERRILKLEKVA